MQHCQLLGLPEKPGRGNNLWDKQVCYYQYDGKGWKQGGYVELDRALADLLHLGTD